MRTELNRRSLLSRGGTLAPLVGLGLLGGATAATADSSTKEGRLIPLLGTWAVQVTFQSPNIPSEAGLFAFVADGIFFGTTTGAGHLSLGSWHLTSGGFQYAFRHFMYADDDGRWVGEVRVQQNGKFTSANSWEASGTGTAFDTQGNQLQVVQSATAGTRY
ncbi:hypothetical protein [Nonomuraea aurantiaca]|jgi:hypothetical protein|uniref:hypothetical protein n=1 Tax=Nonomuraea aurantiaca TaxID=2878562 RepID=UPI001CD9242A|nr:hypothetical protein [Nonomuraea aurantiaca]MCA2228526.1 hypothetical protein [Nonomuraea aurantiaca]